MLIRVASRIVMTEAEHPLTKKQLAEALQVSVRTVDRWVAENRIPYLTLPCRGSRVEVRFLWSKVLRSIDRSSGRKLGLSRHVSPRALRKETHE